MEKSISSVSKALEDAERCGELINYLISEENRVHRQEYGSILSSLHNSGKISLVSTENLAAIKVLVQNDFWSVIHIFEQVIPELNCSYRDVLELVQTIDTKAGSDSAPGMTNIALVKWCKNNPEQSKLIVEGAKCLDTLCLSHCVFALQGLESIELAFELLNHSDKRVNSLGFRSLGILEIDDQIVASSIIDECYQAIQLEQLPIVRSSAIETVFKIWKKIGSSKPYRQQEFLDIVLKAKNDDELVQISAALFYHSKALTADSIDMILSACTNEVSNPEAILHWINLALHSEKVNWDFTKVVDVFSAQLPKIKPSTNSKQFNHFCKYVLNDADRLGQLISSWFTSGQFELCEFLSSMLGGSNKNRIITLSKDNLPNELIDQIFLARKCVGFLWIHEVTAASILLGIIKNGKKSAQLEAEKLLYNPLLLSYSGELRDFLEKQSKSSSKRIRDSIGRLIKLHDAYIAGLEKTNDLVEFIPTIEQRRTAAMKERERNKDISKQAHKKSMFSQLISYQTLLYGKKSFSLIHGPDGNKTPNILPLSNFSYSAELPRLSVVDPVGYQEMLTILRIEWKISK